MNAAQALLARGGVGGAHDSEIALTTVATVLPPLLPLLLLLLLG